MENDDFYIGYLDKAPPKIGRLMRTTVIGLLSLTGVVALLMVFGQSPFYPSSFEFLQYRTFEGVVEEHPYPMIRVMRPGDAGSLPSYSHFLLVNEGKIGAQESVAGLDGQRIRLEGTLIYRDDQTMIEVRGGTVETLGSAVQSVVSIEKNLGVHTLTGEIVDSKCFLGVMNPGSHKPHRACATRCISGGIPPMFVVNNEAGQTTYLLLRSADGSPVNKQVLDVVAEPLEITGEVMQVDDVLMLSADPTTYRRLNP